MLTSGTYFKRYRMERKLSDLPPVPPVSADFELAPWRSDLHESHAAVMFASFRDEIDSVVFPTFGYYSGCTDLIESICTKSGFEPEATWLMIGPTGPCGTVQGIRDSGFGAIQNLGVAPYYRGRGLGKLLLLQSLHGFARLGLKNAYLEVTARNESAVRLYRHLEFRSTRTIYKAVATLDADAAVMI